MSKKRVNISLSEVDIDQVKKVRKLLETHSPMDELRLSYIDTIRKALEIAEYKLTCMPI